ncbi:hypothetical protein [Mangrovibacterium sp.]|uniref:hypothetical protein n=1 Tax=Mangrovibacterium sp. TaxID=1961364 RepID=UPI0035669D13
MKWPNLKALKIGCKIIRIKRSFQDLPALKAGKFLLLGVCLSLFYSAGVKNSKQQIYHNGWVDFNKNGMKDIFEDPRQQIDARVADLLSQMTVEE